MNARLKTPTALCRGDLYNNYSGMFISEEIRAKVREEEESKGQGLFIKKIQAKLTVSSKIKHLGWINLIMLTRD